MSELTVILKDSERTYRQKFLMYSPFIIGDEPLHPDIVKCINEAKLNFQGEPEEITIRITQEIQ
jgi:hypothetical protein